MPVTKGLTGGYWFYQRTTHSQSTTGISSAYSCGDTRSGYHAARQQWRKNKGKYLFNGKALAKVWRAKMLEAINHQLKMALPTSLPNEWVVNCQRVGKGLPALKYLSRYLYRGVLPDRDIIKVTDTEVSFRYTDSETKQSRLNAFTHTEIFYGRYCNTSFQRAFGE